MADFDKVRLGFDTEFLEEQLAKASQLFDEFTAGVKSKLDQGLFSDAAVKNLYTVNEQLAITNDRLRQQADEMRKLSEFSERTQQTQALSQAQTGGPMQPGMGGGGVPGQPNPGPTPTQQNQQGFISGIGAALGSAALQGGLGAVGGAFGMNLGNLVNSGMGLGGAMLDRRKIGSDDDEGKAKNREDILGSLKDFTQAAFSLTVGLGIRGLNTIKQEQDEALSLSRLGKSGENSAFDLVSGMARDKVTERYGLTRREALGELKGFAGAARSGNLDFETLSDIQMGMGGGGAAAQMLGQGLVKGQFESPQEQKKILTEVVGLGVTQGLSNARMPDLFSSISNVMQMGYGKRDTDAILSTLTGMAKVGGKDFEGAEGVKQAEPFLRMGMDKGGGRDLGLAVAMSPKEMGGMGLDFHAAKRWLEQGGMQSAEGKAGLHKMFGGAGDEIMADVLEAKLGTSFTAAEAFTKGTQGPAATELGAKGATAIEARRKAAREHTTLRDNIERRIERYETHVAGGAIKGLHKVLVAASKVLPGVEEGDFKTLGDIGDFALRYGDSGTAGDGAPTSRGASLSTVDLSSVVTGGEQQHGLPPLSSGGGLPPASVGGGGSAHDLLRAFVNAAPPPITRGAQFQNPGMETAFHAMSDAMFRATGRPAGLSGARSGFRTREDEEAIWSESDQGRRYAAARPGHSHHGVGGGQHAVDFDQATRAFALQHPEFGFNQDRLNRAGVKDKPHFEFDVNNVTQQALRVTIEAMPARTHQQAVGRQQQQGAAAASATGPGRPNIASGGLAGTGRSM